MKSSLEYFENAARCEEQARQAIDEISRGALESTAQHWLKLGKLAQQIEAKVPPPDRPPTSSRT